VSQKNVTLFMLVMTVVIQFLPEIYPREFETNSPPHLILYVYTVHCNKKAVLSQRRPRDAPYI